MKSAIHAAPARIPSLDGLRAVSVCLVLAGHAAGGRYFLPDSWIGPLGTGELGVRVFFIISGFLITSLLMKELGETGRVSLSAFYFRRTLRIFPAFYAFLAATAVAAYLQWIVLQPGDLFYAATYTINYHHVRSWWLGHVWSLSVEEQFYLIWPAVVAWAGMQRAMTTAAVVVVLCPVIRTTALIVYPGTHPWMGEAFPTVADGLATGCLLAGYRDRLSGTGWYRRLLESPFFNLVPLTAFALNCYPGGRLRAAILQTVIQVCIVVTIDRYVRMPGTATGRLLNVPWLASLGVLSYSLYLWQQPFLQHQKSSLPFPLNILVALAAAWISYKFVEIPFLNLRKRIEKWAAERPVSRVWRRFPAETLSQADSRN